MSFAWLLALSIQPMRIAGKSVSAAADLIILLPAITVPVALPYAQATQIGVTLEVIWLLYSCPPLAFPI